jgi:hypothetical protein
MKGVQQTPLLFVESKVCYSALFTNLVRWHAGTVSFPLSDIIMAQLACPLSDVMFCLHSGTTNLSLYKHCYPPQKYIFKLKNWQKLAKSLFKSKEELENKDIQRCKNRLFKFCYVPATSAVHNRLLFCCGRLQY